MIKINEWLSPKSVYICPVCGEQAKEYSDCQKHIEQHEKPEKIVSYSNISVGNYPAGIVVEMSSGVYARYQFDDLIVPEEFELTGDEKLDIISEVPDDKPVF